MIQLIEAVEKARRPGVLGAVGARLERRCKKDLRAYFEKLGADVVDLAQYADYGKDAALMAVEVRLKRVLRGHSELLASILEANIADAFLAALKQDVTHEQALAERQRKKFGIKEAEFQEWPDSTGYDDHGREGTAGVFKKRAVKSTRAMAKAYNQKLFKAAKYEEVPIDDLTPTQGHIDRELVARHQEIPYGNREAPHVMKWRGKRVVMDGHHRIAAAKAEGRTTVKVSLLESVQEADPIGLDVKDKVGPTGQDAVEYAKKKAADLVTGINETTRQQLRDAVAQGIDEQLGVPGTARIIRDLLDVWDTSRAEMIASTEMNDSMSEAQFRKMKALSVEYKQIILSDDACEICQENADEDPLPVDQPYQSGDLRSPFHPNCRCAVTGARPPADA